MKLGAIGVVALLFAGYGLSKLRLATNGLRNAFSPSYWTKRNNGEFLFNTETNVFKRGPYNHKEICFTFDDGPHPASIERILAILKQYNAHATFFVVGKRVKENPKLAREIVESGNEIANHTQDHLRLDTLTMKQVKAEVENCETNVKRATGTKMTLFRPPGMRYTPEIIDYIKSKGYITVAYNIGAKDFTGKDVSGDVIKERILKQIEDGAIVLLHDNPLTADALPGILESLEKDGYKIKSVGETLKDLPHPISLPPQHVAG